MKKSLIALALAALCSLFLFVGCKSAREALETDINSVQVAGNSYRFTSVECDDGEAARKYRETLAGLTFTFTDETNGSLQSSDGTVIKNFTYRIVSYASSVGVQMPELLGYSIDGCVISSSWNYTTKGNLSSNHTVDGTDFYFYFTKVK